MKRIALDTNSILDAFLDRSSDTLTRSLFHEAKAGKTSLFIPQIVFFELAWVLKSFYKKEKTYIIGLFRSLLTIKTLETSDTSLLMKAIDCFEQNTISFTDAYILQEIQMRQIDQFLTHDKKLIQLFTGK